ncbi:Kelch-type beta propeller [Phytophthora cactorum]|nr:Kelch-type beta propeller [Phytophthora cactorum]
MGQQVSLPATVTPPPGERAKLRQLQAPYVPLCDVLKAGDAGVTEDIKDTMDNILEFGAALRYLPKVRAADEGAHEPVDSVDELFQYISQLAGLPTHDGRDPARPDAKRDAGETMPGVFDARVASYVKNLQAVYQMTKKEKHRYEQRLLAARAHAMSLSKVSPPPLPLPTQNCLTMGWDLVVMLLKATHKNNPEQYEHALQMVKDNLKPLKPTAYSDSMYLAPSASSAFNLLSDCLGNLAYPAADGSPQVETHIGARTIETLAEVGLARGSLATMLSVVLWLMKQPPTSSNSYGELGTGDDIERHQLTSVALCGWDDIRQVVSGNETLAVLTNDGVLLTCGLNKSGQCGQGHFDERVMMLRPVQSLRSQRVKFIAASNGCEHMIALTDSGLAYSWGYNDRGQLGHENLTTKIHAPKLIDAVITDSGELYTFGMNDCGQLGLDHTQHQSAPQLVKSLEGTEVSMVACGLYHTIICTAAGGLYSCGKNDYGQLALGHNRQIKLATLVSLPNEMLGIGNKVHQNVPNVVALSANTRMVRATCGCYHTVLLSEQGQVFVFGRNNKGQLGNRGSADALLPVPLKRKRENDEGDSILLDQSCVISVCGRVDIDRSGEVEGLSNFGSISTIGVSLFRGKWFYEVEVVTSGLIQVGWIDGYFQGSSDQGEGVGDHAHSWSYDGNRQRRWNSGSSSYGEKWRAGDIIGCLLDLTTQEMTFFRNGVNLGVAYSEFKCSMDDKRSGMMPGISLERGEIIRINLGHQPFAYPPAIGRDFESVSRAVLMPSSSAVIQSPEDQLSGGTPIQPPPLEGSASVLADNKLFVVGGIVVNESSSPQSTEPTNQVWMFDIASKIWERWTDFPIGICHHQVVAVDDNQVLVLGGEKDCAASRHMDLYKCSTLKHADGSLPTWTLVQAAIGAATSLPQSRAFHTASTIHVRLDTIVFMYGGKSVDDEILGDAWYLSLDDYTWSRLPSSVSLDPGPRIGCSSAVIGECVYIFGGKDREDKFRSDLWRYNTFDRLWHLCHDDNIGASKDAEGSLTRSDSQSMLPDGRVDYNPKEATFSALYALLEDITTRFFGMDTLDEKSNSTPLVTHVLYPLLVTIRLLKLNFFEFARSCLDGSEIGLPATAYQSGGVLCLIQKVLFTIADHVPKLPLSGEVLWFYHAVKHETASAIYHGFPTLFPSLLDRLQVMNRLMVNKHNSEEEMTPAQKLLVPMLVPSFTSAKMLFQLISDPNVLFKVDGLSDEVVSESVITFMSTLLDSLWAQTKHAMDQSSEGVTKLMKSLDTIETSNEFNCLNIMLRAAIFWSRVSVSKELAIYLLSQSSDSSVTYGQIFKSLWDKITHVKGYTSWKKVSFLPSRTILSQHVYPEVGRNEALLLQVIDNVGNGKKLLDKVRNALDPGSAPGGGNPQLRAARLKRQDSVEATLEKSGGIEAVDRAVRATFAALLKHTNISYTTEPISNQGALAETVVDAWKAALQLRRWYMAQIVREQQKLAAAVSEAGAPSGFSPDMGAKERQQALYNAVCEPIIRRARLLLQLSPVPIQTTPPESSPMKLLPGISMATTYDFAKASQSESADTPGKEPEQKRFTRQLNKLMKTKSVEVMEEEDEQIHADIFSFIQQSSTNLVTPNRDSEVPSRHPEDQMREILLAHQKRANMRLQGLKTFVRLLQCTENIPSSRLHVIPMLSSAFKRVHTTHGKLSAGQTSTIKVHYLVDLEFAGPQLSDTIGREFFHLLTILLKSSTDHLRRVQQLIDTGGVGLSDMKTSPASIQRAVHDMLLVLETCCFPYRGQDWDHLQRTNLVKLLTDLTSWKGWQTFIQYDASDNSPADVNSTEKYAILPAATGSKYPNIICSRYITLGTDLRKLMIAHKSLDGSDESTGSLQDNGGLAVFDKSFYRGRWYWEVLIRTLGDTPVFVGVTPGTADLNTDLAGCGYFPSIGVKGADVHWNLAAAVPPKLWCSSSNFQFSNAIVSAGLVATPFDGATISWNGKRKGSHLQLMPNGTTLSAGECSSSDGQFETIVASQGFENESIFVEIRVVAAGKDGRSALSFGIVGSDFSEFDAPLKQKLDVKWKSAEEVLEWGVFGVLFDFEKATATLYSDRSEPENQHTSSSSDLQLGKSLQLQLYSCDGGEFSSSHAASNCLVDDTTVYSSAKGTNVNLVLKHEIDTPMCVSYINVRGPGQGYSSPLRCAAVFVISTPPDLSCFQDFDNMTPEQFAALPFPPSNGCCPRDESLPVAFFVLDGSSTQISKQLAYPVTGRYIVVKAICPSAGTNIDIGYIGFCGIFDRDNGPAYTETTAESYSCEECKRMPSSGVYYDQRDDDSIKLCAACYDDNRGDLDSEYYGIRDISGGNEVLAVVMKDGGVFTCGLNKSGQCGNGTFEERVIVATPFERKVPHNNGSGELSPQRSRVQQWRAARVCDHHEKGKLVTWGRNDYGQLGIGSKEHKNTAQFVPLPLSSKIKNTSCGCYHTLILMSNGRVMVFGRNNKGQLGAGSRTLPSADLPLPVPSNSLANDEVVRIAAGFYSSYILTGRSGDSPGLDGTPDDANQAKDLPENSCLENSDALFESLMKEIDSKYVTDSIPKRAPLQLKRGYPQRKLPLVKLHAAGWAMARALMYRSLQDAEDRTSKRTNGRVNPVLSMFISFLLENLKLLQGDSVPGSTNAVLTATAAHELGGSVSLKRICVGLLQYFGTRFAVPAPTAGPVSPALDNLHGHFYKNQILSVLLACGSANTNVGSTIAANAVVTAHIISGMNSSDLASATMCIRLAMLVFPQHSVSALNTIYRSQQSAPVFSGDILTMLMTLVGLPLLLRPRLCSHELGLECSSTALCQSARCLKGITVTKDTGIAQMQQVVLEKAHVADAKAAEVVALLRYLTLYPTWKVAINAAVSRGFAKSNKVGELLDSICAYYTSVQQADVMDLQTAVLGGLTGDKDATSLRKPESTTSSPETDESVNNIVDGNTQPDESESISRDKQSLKLWQKAKDALDGLATIIAAVSIVGGHVEGFREGGCVTVEEDGTQGSSKLGVLSGVMRDPRTADLMAKVVVNSSTEGPVSPLIPADARAQSFPLSKLHAVERIPALVDMFGDVESIITTLSSIVSEVLSVDEECAMHCDLDLPQNSSVQEVLRNRLKLYKQQIRWRSAKALSSLLKQIPSLSPTLLSMDSQLVSSLATLLSSENSLSWASKSETSGLETATALQKRWICVKQRQVFLDTEEVIDSALDQYEVTMRNEVVQKLGSENALSWGMDAIQSPRRAGNSAIDYTPFPLTAPIIRVGRAADACDLIVNDRSVSGRHFHLRRLRREAEGGEAQYELQDFSKNGTIVNGVRIHGSSTRITTGSRISLILSRGGLVTYEFQVRSAGGGTGSRNAPPPIVTAAQNPGDLNISIPGQEYQQPQIGTPQIVPRSPAELQNRGTRGGSVSSEGLADGRSRQTVTQGLRVITSIAESDVPRALLSPNPAVDSPRAGGYSSPRSSVLQAPGTPSVGPLTPSMFSSMIPPAILSPASYQQRESFAPNESPGVTSPQGGVGSMLRIALGRDSVNRESSSQRISIPSELAKTRILRSSGQSGLATRSNPLQPRRRKYLHYASLLGLKKQTSLSALQSRSRGSNSRNYPSSVRHLGMVLGRSEHLQKDAAGNLQTSEPLVNFQDIGDENPSYALTESSALRPPVPPRLAARGNASPVKTKKVEHAGNVDTLQPKSDLTLWSECNSSFDDGVRQMNAFEVELEEEVLCERLAAIHARKILLQVVRLFNHASQTEEAPLSELTDPLVLRPLISILNVPEQANVSSSYELEYQLQKHPKAQKSGKIQQILSRMAHDVMARSPTETLARNLCSSQNLSTLQRSIDQVTEQPTKIGWTGITRLIESLVENEQTRGEDVNDQEPPNTLENLTFETILHILSRTYAAPMAALSWESSPLRARKADGCFPKGPMRLSCGLEVLVVDTYERLWSIPPPDPLLKHRHKWRKRFSSAVVNDNGWMKSAADYAVTIWRPSVPPALESATSGTNWFCLGDVAKCGTGAPDAPMLLVSDSDNQGLLLPPVSFERVDITGKGLPRNSESDPDFQRKQLRSIWWPVAPSGYVALGCVAGSKEDPFEPPDVSFTRCVREDIVKRVEGFHCVWRAASPASTGGGGVELPTTIEVENEAQDEENAGENDGSGQTLRSRSVKNQSTDASRLQLLLPVADDVVVQTSLWAVDSDFSCGLLLPVVTLNDASANEPSTAFALNLSDDDLVLCAPVSVDNVLVFLEILLQYQHLLSTKQQDKHTMLTQLRPELPAALFTLIQQVLRENQPSSGKAAVSLVRALITVIQRGALWYDKQALLYCRSKIMALSQDQDGGFTLHALLQAFVELMLAVEDQQHSQRVQELAACLERDGGNSLSLPYRFHFAKQPFVEMLVSHSSKMAVTRHLSGEERKFLLDYRAEDGGNREALAVEGLGVPPGEVYSCRFEHTPALVMTMRDETKAEIVYFEVTVVEWSTISSMGGSLALGFSPPTFPLEGVLVGGSADGARSYSFAPANGQVLCAGDTVVDRWRWMEPVGAVSPGDVFGCGLRLDTQEIFFCKNGQLLGTAFSSISRPQQLHPTISFNADCKLLANLGATTATPAKHANFSFRFHSLDCDNLMSAFEWFEPLSQVYGVMKALMDPARPEEANVRDEQIDEARDAAVVAQLPDEFMLSADNFLSDISEDVCIRVESAHPYDIELQESLVSIPLATSIRVRLDPQSETASSHCLQILQGGSTTGGEGEGTTTGGEAEVRAFTGACGGQEVTIDGDSFVWRFPVQSNFQCRVDRVRKGPYLKLEARDTRLSLVRDKGWQTAIGVARFDGGIHIWEVRISFVTASSNIFLGIGRRDVRLDSYLGKDNRGWGWIGNRALWHNGSKQRGTYGDKFKTGDTIRLTLDLRRGTLSYALNGKDLGVAFGPGGTGPKLEGTFYPAFALYNQRDSIDLIGGHRVEDGGLEPGLSRTGSGLASGEDSYYSEEEEEDLGGNQIRLKLRRLHASQRVFTPARDRALVQLVNEICETRAEALLSCDPLRMTPEEFVPTEEQIHGFPALRGIPLEALQRRFLVLRNFNCRLQTSLAFIDFSANDERSLLARGARALRGVVFQHVKLAWWLGVLKEQQAPAAARPEIEVDRHRAHDALELSERGDPLASDAGERDSVFAQTFEQLHGLQPALLRGADRAFKCQFVGEFGDDFGGLYRECLAQLSSELQTFTPLLPLFRPCPNALMSTGENRELFVPNSHLRSHPKRVQMAEFLGKLAGVAVRTKTPLDLNLPPAVWKLLVGQQVTRHDIEAVHQGCFHVVDTIATLDSHGITEEMFDDLVDASFTVLSSTRESVELVPGGKHVHVTWEDREEYACAVETYRLTEFAPVCGDLSRGVATILPAPTLGIFSWHELRTLVCGKATVDIALLRRRTIYGDGCQATDPHIAYFWDVLAEFTDEQKSSFLRFVWYGPIAVAYACCRLHSGLQDLRVTKAAGRADMYLPIAHTCFFSIDLPAYSCREVMHDKLVYAITHCQSIDADNTTVAQRAGQGINWTNTATTATATAAAAVSTVIAGMASVTGE